MKILTIIFCLFLSVNAFGQNKDTAIQFHERSVKSITNSGNPLIIVDGITYKKDLNTINPDNIESVNVLKGDSATARYGASGANGVIIIKMKLHTTVDTTKVDASGKDPLYIVDGKVVPSINKIKAGDIMETAILPDSTAVAKYGPKAANGAMVVTTVAGAITIYERKLSTFNKRYKNYLEKHHGDDTKLAYVINNTILTAKGKKTVGQLYDIEPKDIAKVDYRTDRRFSTDATIVITTTDDSN